MKRRTLLQSISLGMPAAPVVLAAPHAASASQLLPDASGAFIYDAHLSFARSLAGAIAKSGRKAIAIECDENGFWRSADNIAFREPLNTLSGATSRRTYFFIEQMFRQHWRRQLSDAVIVHEDGDVICWMLKFQSVRQARHMAKAAAAGLRKDIKPIKAGIGADYVKTLFW